MGLTDWLQHPVSQEPWRPWLEGHTLGGVMQGVLVTNGHEVACLKPGMRGRTAEPSFCPALERIAARLAHAASVPVPPVQLYMAQLPDGTAYPSCLSYAVGGPFAPRWMAVMNGAFGDEGHEVGMLALAAYVPIVVFDAWVAADDRDGGNAILAGWDDINVRSHWQSIDYSRSMVWHAWWRCRGYDETAERPALAELVAWLRDHGTTDLWPAVARIQGLVAEDIALVVEEIPETFLSESERDMVVEGLLHRQRNLEEMVTQWLFRSGIQ